MRVTRENIKDIKCYTGVERPLSNCAELLESLLEEVEELNGNRYNKLFINYIDTHTEYSPERTDPCPDYYGLLTCVANTCDFSHEIQRRLCEYFVF